MTNNIQCSKDKEASPLNSASWIMAGLSSIANTFTVIKGRIDDVEHYFYVSGRESVKLFCDIKVS